MDSDKLPFNADQLETLRNKLEHLKQANTDLSTSVPESWQAFEKYKDVLNQTSESAGKSEASHEALGQALGSVGQAVPELSGAMEGLQALTAGGALNAVLAITQAWEIYQQRIAAATEAISEVQMPDLTAGITQAQQLATHWNGIADAIKKANEQFNSVEQRHDRNKSADEKDHDRRQQTLELNKEQALANLELKKGEMTPAQYQLNQAGIKNDYTGQAAAEDQRFDQQKLQRKEQYQKNLQAQSQTDAAQAAAIKLPASQAEFDAQQKAMQARADTLGETAAKYRKTADEIHDNQADSAAGITGAIRSVPGLYQFAATYGWGAKRDDVAQGDEKEAMDEAATQTAVLKEMARRKTAWDEKTKLQNSAAQEAGESQTIAHQLHGPDGDDAQFQADTQNRRATTQARQTIDTTKALAEAADHGQNMQAAFDALHRAHLGNWDHLQKQMQTQAETIRGLKSQVGVLAQYGPQ